MHSLFSLFKFTAGQRPLLILTLLTILKWLFLIKCDSPKLSATLSIFSLWYKQVERMEEEK